MDHIQGQRAVTAENPDVRSAEVVQAPRHQARLEIRAIWDHRRCDRSCHVPNLRATHGSRDRRALGDYHHYQLSKFALIPSRP